MISPCPLKIRRRKALPPIGPVESFDKRVLLRLTWADARHDPMDFKPIGNCGRSADRALLDPRQSPFPVPWQIQRQLAIHLPGPFVIPRTALGPQLVAKHSQNPSDRSVAPRKSATAP